MKILVTGGSGFIGRHVVNKLLARGYEVSIAHHCMDDLKIRENVHCLFYRERPTHVIHLAANLGGIGYHMSHSTEILHDNTLMGLNMLGHAQEFGVEKFVNLGTSCSYPMDATTPLLEESLWQGFPSPVTAPYGISKLLLMLQGQTMRKETGFNAITVIPANVYGPGDTFDDAKSHVIPALIKKALAARGGDGIMDIWGTGSATREFIYVDDCAEAIVRAMESYDEPEPMNIGTGIETPIAAVATWIAEVVGVKMRWDSTKPDGSAGRVFNISRMLYSLGFSPKVDLKEGIMKTIDWYRSTL